MGLDALLEVLAENPNAPCEVAEVALWVARDEYQDLDIEAYLGELRGMAREAQAYVRGSLDARVAGLTRYLFHEMGFHGNLQEYYDPRNSYLNDVLDRRTGIPISLSVLAMAIGERTGLPLLGVGLPGHFILKAYERGRPEILFDPFHGGRRLGIEDCANLVRQVTGAPLEVTEQHLRPVSMRALVTRIISNLKAVYLKQTDFPRAIRVMQRLRQLNPQDSLQHRDLGVAYLQVSQPGRAIDHLSAYLAEMPHAEDQSKVRKLLDKALTAVGQWN